MPLDGEDGEREREKEREKRRERERDRRKINTSGRERSTTVFAVAPVPTGRMARASHQTVTCQSARSQEADRKSR